MHSGELLLYIDYNKSSPLHSRITRVNPYPEEFYYIFSRKIKVSRSIWIQKRLSSKYTSCMPYICRASIAMAACRVPNLEVGSSTPFSPLLLVLTFREGSVLHLTKVPITSIAYRKCQWPSSRSS